MKQKYSTDMSPSERAALWRQRLFEAEAGLTRYLTETRGGRDIDDWISVRSEIFHELPTQDAESASPEAWQRVFFRAQALMERFLVSRYGHGELAAWARAGAEVHRWVEPEHGHGALDPVLRIARQAELYGSRYRILADGPERAALEISHCAIWDYRKKAEARGVPLTLASPCEYCVHATGSNIAAKGFTARHELDDGPEGPGCTWEATQCAE
ncbi:hypothetical protein ACFYVL_06005 [Streptomyces sp. NPDC004111]|uniref:hypothetical protein n=1 Tax=Streptomyces sp. NPDC004111 TaxID=3364690 RepID=UPI00367C91BF